MRYLLGGLAPMMVLYSCCPQGEPVRQVVRLDAEERASYEQSLERMRGELAAALANLARAEEAAIDAGLGIDVGDDGEAARRAHELDACRQDLARHRAGLERAVAQLNRQQPGTSSANMRPGRPAVARDYGRVHVHTPRVKDLNLGVLVEYRLYSTRDSDMKATAVIRLLEDGQEVDVERQAVTVGAHASYESSAMFHRTTNPTGIYTAQVTLEERP